MVCYLIKFGNEKPPRERFVVVLYFIPVCTGNAKNLVSNFIVYPVYPCVYRERALNNFTFANEIRFIPVCTGNAFELATYSNIAPVYPCVYRERHCS